MNRKGVLLRENNIFFIQSRNTRKSLIYSYFGVSPNSYMGTLVTRMYDFYCLSAINLFNDFKKYYKAEFETFDSFLSKKYFLFDEEINKLKSQKLYYKTFLYEPDINIKYLLKNCDNIRDVMIKFLGGEINEN